MVRMNLNPQSLSRFASCLQGIAGLLECPVCLEIIRPPSWQCCHGHLICSGCRSKSTKCPICRVMLGRGRCIVADKLFNFLVQTLGQHEESVCDGAKIRSPKGISKKVTIVSLVWAARVQEKDCRKFPSLVCEVGKFAKPPDYEVRGRFGAATNSSVNVNET
ncbi:hypothetical protein RP20_CCG028595 [Aedes albopictus]|nr:hypothetical protein RP20_CCG028595 [Aedes albopictus]